MIRRRPRTLQDENHKETLPLVGPHDDNRNKRRSWYKRALPLSVLAVVLLRIIDFRAISEYPDPIHPVDTSKLINKTLILMIETRNPPPKTVCINKDYASRNGYDFELVTDHWCFSKYRNRFQDLVHLWCRPLIFKDALKRYKSIFYLDSDAYFVKPEMSIESFFDYARKNSHFLLHSGETTLVGADDCGTFFSNGGIQFWRKTRYTDRMLTTWFLLYRRQFIFYWLRIHWLPNCEIHYFMNREQGSYKAAADENEWIKKETSIIRYGKETWHLPYSDRGCILKPKWESTFFLNHVTSNFGSLLRSRLAQEQILKQNVTCQ